MCNTVGVCSQSDLIQTPTTLHKNISSKLNTLSIRLDQNFSYSINYLKNLRGPVQIIGRTVIQLSC
jgi:hypothetical protein